MKTYTFCLCIFLSFSFVCPEAISQVEFSIYTENGMNPYGAKKHSEYSTLFGVKKDKMKIGYTINHPSTSQIHHDSPKVHRVQQQQEQNRVHKNQYNHQSTYSQANNHPTMTYQSYPYYDPPKISKKQYQPPSYDTVNFNKFPSYTPQLTNSQSHARPHKRINLPKKLTVHSNAALLPNASPYAAQQNHNLGVNLGEALDKSVPLTYY